MADKGGDHNTPDAQNALIIFLSEIAIMQVIFWKEDNFSFISDCRNSFDCKLQKLINEQIIIFNSPSNALCSSGESAEAKHFKHHTSIVCIPFPLSSIGKYWISAWWFLLMKTQRVLTRSSKCANMCYHKKQMFL